MDDGGGGATIGEDGVYYARVGRRDCVVRHGTARHGAGREKNSISETVRVCMVAESRERPKRFNRQGKKKCGEHGKSYSRPGGTVRVG
ncbi:uncharacterized protein LOC105425465 [Pogonomyrmex barbatus]|uniref:Uncharacterized protein LOC105425465 n=1 Tax=Pogonomyrmex barbatus TaxID=144034 RepID=A0A6I9W0U9_9HYME|nr:uncharacterized protein LOC105425465 [Pogonomyrmex barbatus]